MVWAQSRRKPTILFLATCHEDTEILARDRSIHEGNFLLYVDTLTQLEWLFHALDHYNYARAISVHLRDMMMLQDKHPDVYAAFCEGKFTVNKTCRPFSRMALDESHEQNNASVKGDGGVGEFLRRLDKKENTCHPHYYEDKPCKSYHNPKAQHNFHILLLTLWNQQFVNCLVNQFYIFRKPSGIPAGCEIPYHSCEEHGQPLLWHQWRSIGSGYTWSGKCSCCGFCSEHETSWWNPTQLILQDSTSGSHNCTQWQDQKNNLQLFYWRPEKQKSRTQEQLFMKHDRNLFSTLYIASQIRGADLADFFQHENQSFPRLYQTMAKWDLERNQICSKT